MNARILAPWVLVLVGCASRESSDPTPQAEARPSAADPSPLPTESPDDAKFGRTDVPADGTQVELTQTSVPNGSTSADVEAGINFTARVPAEAKERVVDWLETHASFRDDDGGTQRARVTVHRLTRDNASTHLFQIVPATRLIEDRWYTLDIPSGSDISAVASEPEAQDGTTVHTRFFTGSAPYIRKVVRDATAGRLAAVFSEPVALASVTSGLTVSSADGSIRGCAATAKGACLVVDQPGSADRVFLDFQNRAGLGAGIRLELGDDVTGSGRTVHEARRDTMARNESRIVVRGDLLEAAGRWGTVANRPQR